MIYLLISILYIFILIICIHLIYQYNNDILVPNNIYKKQLYVPLLNNNDIYFQNL